MKIELEFLSDFIFEYFIYMSRPKIVDHNDFIQTRVENNIDELKKLYFPIKMVDPHIKGKSLFISDIKKNWGVERLPKSIEESLFYLGFDAFFPLYVASEGKRITSLNHIEVFELWQSLFIEESIDEIELEGMSKNIFKIFSCMDCRTHGYDMYVYWLFDQSKRDDSPVYKYSEQLGLNKISDSFIEYLEKKIFREINLSYGSDYFNKLKIETKEKHFSYLNKKYGNVKKWGWDGDL